jgi:predicted transcriptional regulator
VTTYRASKVLNINNSTAKAIVRNFKKKGTLFVRKVEENQARSQSSLDPS